MAVVALRHRERRLPPTYTPVSFMNPRSSSSTVDYAKVKKIFGDQKGPNLIANSSARILPYLERTMSCFCTSSSASQREY